MVWNESQFGFGAGSTDSGVRQNGELTANPASGSGQGNKGFLGVLAVLLVRTLT